MNITGHDRLLTPLAGACFAAALLAGCGDTSDPVPADDPVVETSTEETTTDEATTEPADDATGSESPDDSTSDSAGDGESEDQAGGGDTNLFEGTWGFGHDTKTLSAEELATVLEEEAKRQGPVEMSLSVECADGIDTSTQDYTADCTATADEGVEHSWTVTGGPADAGLEVEVENAG